MNSGKGAPSAAIVRILFFIAFVSGCAALIYEVVWFQVLQLVVGSSSVSLGVLLGTYMGGMCIGSLLVPRLVSTRRNALRVCAGIEAAIGVLGVLILCWLPEASVVYSMHAGGTSSDLFWRSAFAAGCLLPPTILMGATLPILTRWLGSAASGATKLGAFYGCNIAGAVIGCLVAGFYLLRVHDTAVATYVAGALNLFAAIALFATSFSRAPEIPAASTDNRTSQSHAVSNKSSLPVYVTIALSGMTALGAEVVWTRLLSLMLGSTVYTFSIILAVFLTGIGIGSHFGTRIGKRCRDASYALGWCQLLLTAAIAWTGYLVSESLPYWPSATAHDAPWMNLQMSLSYCLWALLPATLLWGASFPLAITALAERSNDPARLLGNISAANTFGGIVGGIGFSIVLLPLQGMQYAQRILIVLAAFSAILLLAPHAFALRQRSSMRALFHRAAVALPLVALPLLCGFSIPQAPGQLLAFGHQIQVFGDKTELLFAGEGDNYPVCVSRLWKTNIRLFHVSGKVEASTYVQDMRLQRMLGHLPALLHSKPESVLVVGCGAGVTAGTFALHPDVKKIVVCELEPLVPQIAAAYFGNENYHVLTDPRTHIVSDDARHYILTTDQKFDIITSDPIHPWVKGSANLYTKEYFELVKAHLNRGGIVTQWVPLYQSDPAVIKSELATFFEVFPNGTVWSAEGPEHGSDVVLLGQDGGAQINVDEVQRRLAQAGYSRVSQSLREVGYNSALEVLAAYGGRALDLYPWLADAEINHDQNLRLQYLAGFTVNQQINEDIYQDLLTYRKFPERLFIGSSPTRGNLEMILSRATPKRMGG